MLGAIDWNVFSEILSLMTLAKKSCRLVMEPVFQASREEDEEDVVEVVQMSTGRELLGKFYLCKL